MILDLESFIVAALVLIAIAAVAAAALAWDIRHHTRRRRRDELEPRPPEWVNHPTPTPCGRTRRRCRA